MESPTNDNEHKVHQSLFLDALKDNFSSKLESSSSAKYSPLHKRLKKKFHPTINHFLNYQVRERIIFSLISVYLSFALITWNWKKPWASRVRYLSPVLALAFISPNFGSFLQRTFFIVFGTAYGGLLGYILSYIESVKALIVVYFFILVFFNSISTWSRLSFINFNLCSTLSTALPVIIAGYTREQACKDAISLILMPCVCGIIVLLIPFPRLAIYESKRKIARISHNLIIMSNIVIKSFISKDYYTLNDINFTYYKDCIESDLKKLKELQKFVENEVLVFFYAKDFAISLLVYIELCDLFLEQIVNMNEVVEKIIFNKTQNLFTANIEDECHDIVKEIELIVTIITEYLYIFQPTPFRFLYWIKKLFVYCFKICKGQEKFSFSTLKNNLNNRGLSKDSKKMIQERTGRKRENSLTSMVSRHIFRRKKEEKPVTDIEENYEENFTYDGENYHENDTTIYSKEDKYDNNENINIEFEEKNSNAVPDSLFNKLNIDKDSEIKNTKSFSGIICQKLRNLLIDDPQSLRSEMEIEIQSSIDRLLFSRSKMLHKCNEIRKRNFYNKMSDEDNVDNDDLNDESIYDSFFNSNFNSNSNLKTHTTPSLESLQSNSNNRFKPNYQNIEDVNLIQNYNTEYSNLMNANSIYESTNEIYKENLKYGLNNIGPRGAFLHRFSILIEVSIRFHSIFNKKFSIFTYLEYFINYSFAPFVNFYLLFLSICQFFRIMVLMIHYKFINRSDEMIEKLKNKLIEDYLPYFFPILNAYSRQNRLFSSYFPNNFAVTFIHGVKISIIVIIPYSIVVTRVLKDVLYNGGLWVCLVVILIRSDNISSSFLTSYQRLEGTIIGAIYSFLIYQNLKDRFHGRQIPYNTQLYAILPWIFVCSYYKLSLTHGYSATVASFTPFVLLMGYNYGINSAWGRIEETILGVFLYLVVDNLILPKRYIDDIQRGLISCLKLNEKILFNLDKNIEIILQYERISNDFNNLLIRYAFSSAEIEKIKSASANIFSPVQKDTLEKSISIPEEVDVSVASPELISPITDRSREHYSSIHKLSLSEGVINGKIIDGLNVYSNRDENLNIRKFSSIDNYDRKAIIDNNNKKMYKHIKSNTEFIVDNDMNEDILYLQNVNLDEKNYKENLNNEVEHIVDKIDSDEKKILAELELENKEILEEEELLKNAENKIKDHKEIELTKLKEKIEKSNLENNFDNVQKLYSKRFNFIVANTLKIYNLNSKITNNSTSLIKSYINEIIKQEVMLKFIKYEPELLLFLKKFPKKNYYELIHKFAILLNDYKNLNYGINDLNNILLKMFKKMMKTFEQLHIRENQEYISEESYKFYHTPIRTEIDSPKSPSSDNTISSNDTSKYFENKSVLSGTLPYRTALKISNILKIENISAYMLNFFNLFINFHRILKKMITGFQFFSEIFLELINNKVNTEDFNEKVVNLKIYLKNFSFLIHEEFLTFFAIHNSTIPSTNYGRKFKYKTSEENCPSPSPEEKSNKGDDDFNDSYLMHFNPYFIFAWLNLHETIKIFSTNLYDFCKTFQYFSNYEVLQND